MTEEKERKSFVKFKGLIRVTDQAHVDEYNTAIKENMEVNMYILNIIINMKNNVFLIIFYNVSIIFKNLKLYKINKQRTNNYCCIYFRIKLISQKRFI